jgi:hypothetical protein
MVEGNAPWREKKQLDGTMVKGKKQRHMERKRALIQG